MRYCEACKVQVDNPLEHCPLCFHVLSSYDGVPEDDSYPDYQGAARRYNLILRILLMLSLTAGVTCLTINLLTKQTFLWSLVVIANILYMWLAVPIALRRRYSVGFKVMAQAFLLASLVVVVDLIIGHNSTWAYDYVLPFLFATATLTITVISIVKRVKLREFILYFILIALLGFVPLLLLAVGLVRVSWPSMVSALYAGLSLVSLFVFADSATKIELKKRFHI
ncbi:MAG: DUF6320 domain-containing protein [Oscillospiraceae bacterium]|jgi:hypothetical protein